MNMNELLQTFKKIVENYNLVEGQNRGLNLDYHIFNSATDTLIYNLEITNLAILGESFTSMLYFAKG